MERYKIVLESQLGPREGALWLKEERGGAVTGLLTLLGFENSVCGEWLTEHTLRLSHHLRTLVSDLACVSLLELEGERLAGTLQSGGNTMQWHGEKISEREGERKKNAGE